MDQFTSLSAIIVATTLFIIGVLAIELWLDYRWAREAQSMKLKRGWKA